MYPRLKKPLRHAVRACLTAFACMMSQLVMATLTVMTEGAATLRDGDIPLARELATQRALSRAAESAGFSIQAETQLGPDGVTETARITTQTCVKDYTTLHEHVGSDEVFVILEVTLDPDGRCEQVAQCQPRARKHVLVTGFAFEFPEQRRLEEDVRLETLIAQPLANALATQDGTTSTAAGRIFPYRSAASAPALEPTHDLSGQLMLTQAALTAEADYVLSGVFRDFRIGTEVLGLGRRHVAIETFLHDGRDGALIARTVFSSTATGSILAKRAPTSSPTSAGKNAIETAVQDIISDIAAWTHDQIACQP